MGKKKRKDSTTAPAAAAGGTGTTKATGRRGLVIAAVVALAIAVVAAVLVYSQGPSPMAGNTEWQAALESRDAPTLGNPEARVHVVEFLDPACETCASFYPFVKRMMAASPGRIRVSVRYAPFHGNSVDVVKILEAARKQGKYWEALEALLATQSRWAPNHSPQLDLVWGQLAGLGLDLERVRQDMHGADIGRIVEQDVADAKALNVTKTPEFFVNGKPMPSFGYEQLATLVSEALATEYR